MAFLAAKNFCRGLLNLPIGRLTHQSVIKTKNLPLHANFSASLNINNLRFYSQDSSNWITITFEKHDGTQIKRKTKVTGTIQELIGADNPDFPGYGACDGTLSCSTCHIILSKEDFQKLRKASDEEEDTLDLSPCLSETSRLGCCIDITSDMDGMVVKLPAQVRDLRNND